MTTFFPKTFCAELWERITAAARARRMPLARLEEQLGVGKKSLYNISRGRMPQADMILRLSRALHVSTDYLLGSDHAPAAEAPTPYEKPVKVEIIVEGMLGPGGKLSHLKARKAEDK